MSDRFRSKLQSRGAVQPSVIEEIIVAYEEVSQLTRKLRIERETRRSTVQEMWRSCIDHRVYHPLAHNGQGAQLLNTGMSIDNVPDITRVSLAREPGSTRLEMDQIRQCMDNKEPSRVKFRRAEPDPPLLAVRLGSARLEYQFASVWRITDRTRAPTTEKSVHSVFTTVGQTLRTTRSAKAGPARELGSVSQAREPDSQVYGALYHVFSVLYYVCVIVVVGYVGTYTVNGSGRVMRDACSSYGQSWDTEKRERAIDPKKVNRTSVTWEVCARVVINIARHITWTARQCEPSTPDNTRKQNIGDVGGLCKGGDQYSETHHMDSSTSVTWEVCARVMINIARHITWTARQCEPSTPDNTRKQNIGDVGGLCKGGDQYSETHHMDSSSV
ncbi:hypothetical protein J6590_006962 [Homalodisca vitripennis]|nr:hypothetical protein J6590_006962 [Homalodisca vitripennis]